MYGDKLRRHGNLGGCELALMPHTPIFFIIKGILLNSLIGICSDQ